MRRPRRPKKRVSIWEIRLNDGRHLWAFGYSAQQALCIITDTVFPGKTLEFVRYEFEPTGRRIPDGLRIRIGSTMRTAEEWCRRQEPGFFGEKQCFS